MTWYNNVSPNRRGMQYQFETKKKRKEMKKSFVILLAMCLFAVAPAAAQLDWGIKAGINLSEKPSKIDDVKNKTGWFIGPTAKVMLPIVGLGVEANLLYSRSESEMQGQDVVRQTLDVPVFLRYELSLPVVNQFIEPFIAAGPQWSWNIGEKNFSLNYGDYRVKESALSLNLGAGVILLDHIQIHANYNIALGNTSNYTDGKLVGGAIDHLTSSKSKTNTWQFSVAYMF